jgi:hypothetical protein
MKIAQFEIGDNVKIDDSLIFLNSEEAGIIIDVLVEFCKRNKIKRKAKKILTILEKGLPYKPYL